MVHGASQLNMNGALNSLSTVKTLPSYSLKGKPSPERAKETPGPGAYGLQQVSPRRCKSPKACGFGTSTKIPALPAGSPGPGEYQMKDVSAKSAPKGGSFGTMPRSRNPRGEQRPGPGAYHPGSPRLSPASSPQLPRRSVSPDPRGPLYGGVHGSGPRFASQQGSPPSKGKKVPPT